MSPNLAQMGGRALGSVGAGVDGRRLAMHGAALVVVGAGGAFTGWLAAGSRKGAVIGALVHLGLFGLTGTLFGGGRLQTPERVVYGLVGLGGVAGAAYLHFGRSKR